MMGEGKVLERSLDVRWTDRPGVCWLGVGGRQGGSDDQLPGLHWGRGGERLPHHLGKRELSEEGSTEACKCRVGSAVT